MLDQTNKLVKFFRTVKARFRYSEILSLKLRSMGRRHADTKQYNLPTSNDIGALIVRDIGEYELRRI